MDKNKNYLKELAIAFSAAGDAIIRAHNRIDEPDFNNDDIKAGLFHTSVLVHSLSSKLKQYAEKQIMTSIDIHSDIERTRDETLSFVEELDYADEHTLEDNIKGTTMCRQLVHHLDEVFFPMVESLYQPDEDEEDIEEQYRSLFDRINENLGLPYDKEDEEE